jgi:hypothetical protein
MGFEVALYEDAVNVVCYPGLWLLVASRLGFEAALWKLLNLMLGLCALKRG